MIEDDDSKGIKFWFNELDQAKKRYQEYHKEGQRIIDIYTCKDSAKVPFNILFSNTDTLFPALYSAQPRPVVMRRFKDEDPIGKAATMAATRVLEYLIDTNIDGYETFNDGMKSAVIDSLLPGQGATRIKYDAEVIDYEQEIDNDEQDKTEETQEQLSSKESELVCVDSIGWDKVFFGYSTKWSTIPWIAFEEIIDKKEAIRLFGKDIANKIQFLKDDEDEDKATDEENEHKGGVKTATIYQIWDKDGGRKIRYISKHYKDDFLKVDDDPLQLTGFYPIPKPIQLIQKSDDIMPSAIYLVYENQAKEINELTRRINRIVKAIKAKGVYDSELGSDIANLMMGDDNELIPADKSSALSADKGFENAIWFMPIEQLVKVLTQLYQAREACKQVIYEVTGISDIIRGSSVASETATAQNIKSQWGTMRLKRSQIEVQRYARDLLRLMLEVAATKFSETTWAQMTGLPYATDQQVQQAQMIVQAAQQMGEQIPPQLQTIAQQAQQTLSMPKWSEVLDLLKNDIQRSFRVDIETNSTIVPEAVEDQKNMAEVLGSLSQYLQSVTPLIQAGSFPFEAAKALMMSVVRRFQFGAEIEDYIKDMQPPQQPQQPQEKPDNSLELEQGRLQADIQKQQFLAQQDQLKTSALSQLESQKIENQRIIEQGKAATQMRIKEMEIESAERIKEADRQSQEAIALYKADLDAQTKKELAMMQECTMLKQIEMQKEPITEDNSNEELANMIEMSFKELIDSINKPKTVSRNADGSMIVTIK